MPIKSAASGLLFSPIPVSHVILVISDILLSIECVRCQLSIYVLVKQGIIGSGRIQMA